MNDQNRPRISSCARILVVDDHPMTAQTLSRALSQLGRDIHVMSAMNGKAALEIARDGAVDLLITDMMMPEMNGLELIENLKSQTGSRPMYTILITAYDVPGLRESARRLKVNETIIKPVRPEHLCQVVSQALENLELSKPVKTVSDARPAFTILIADDMPDNVSLLARYLQSEGYVFVTAADGMEALEKTRSSMPDLILLDINMPRLDGFKVLEEIRADPAIRHIPVIVLTAARINYRDLQTGLNLGADDYVTKPFDRLELLARIRTRLRVKEAEDLIRRRNRELSLLPEIGRELSARTDIHELMDIVLHRTVETLGAMSGYLILLNSKQPLHTEYHRPTIETTRPQVQLPPLNAFLEEIKETRQGLIINDIRKDSRWRVSSKDPSRSVVMIPMFGRRDLIGLLTLLHEQDNYFNEEHQLLLQAIASQAAIAVENAQLYTRVEMEQQQLSIVLENAADAILLFDVHGCLSLFNPAAQRLFREGDVRYGVPLGRGRGYDALIDALEQALSTGRPVSGEIQWMDLRTLAALLTPIDQGDCVALLHDISHFKNLERVKDEFISTASHDLKNPIASILGFSELLSKAGPLNEIQLDFANRIHSAAGNMNELVQDLLALARMDADAELKQEPVDINALMSQIIQEFGYPALQNKQTLTFSGSEDQPKVRGDLLHLKQAIRNLVGNAIKYTPAHGSIHLSATTDQEHVYIHIRDTGYGIPAEDLPHIFDRFYRVHRDGDQDRDGNGLGLAIVKSVIDKHNGLALVESQVGEGTYFTIRLPLYQEEVLRDVKTDSLECKNNLYV